MDYPAVSYGTLISWKSFRIQWSSGRAERFSSFHCRFIGIIARPRLGRGVVEHGRPGQAPSPPMASAIGVAIYRATTDRLTLGGVLLGLSKLAVWPCSVRATRLLVQAAVLHYNAFKEKTHIGCRGLIVQ